MRRVGGGNRVTTAKCERGKGRNMTWNKEFDSMSSQLLTHDIPVSTEVAEK